ncbi:MAG: hypothetical protein AAGC84_04375 [Pseudomonas sp.]
MTGTFLTFHADEHVVRGLDLLVSATQESYAFHLNQALEHYLQTEIEQLRKTVEGIVDADLGNLSELAQVRTKYSKHVDD